MQVEFLDLPFDILEMYVWNYLSPKKKMLISKKNYYLYSNQIGKSIWISNYDSYIHDMVRSDSSFIFRRLIDKHFLDWATCINIVYSNTRYNRYIDLIEQWTILNMAGKCRALIIEKYKIHGLTKKRSKNNKIWNKRWRN